MKPIRFKTIKNGITALVMLSIFMLFSTYASAQDIMAEITPEAALTASYADPSNNIVLTEGYYIINFNTATTGAIKRVEIEFPAGYDLNLPPDSKPHLLVPIGIGGGSLNKDPYNSQKLFFTVTNPLSIPAGRNIKLFISNIKNNSTITLQSVIITTRDSLNNIIDGPTSTSDIQLTQVTTPMISDNSITTSKIVDGAVTYTKIAPTAVGPSQLSNDAIWSTHILDGTITSADLSDGTITSVDLSFDPATQAELDTHKGSADHDTRYFTEAELSTPGTINTVSNPVDWTNLKNVPSGFADGTDDGGSGASGWTDDGLIVRLTTDTDKVGIGTASPQRTLDVRGLEINTGGNSVNHEAGLSFHNRKVAGFVLNPTQGERWVWYADGTATDGKARLWSGGDKLVVDTVGNVGIGTLSPASKLHVGSGGDIHLGIISNPPTTSGSNIYFENNNGDIKNTFRIDAFGNYLNLVGNSAAGSSTGTGFQFWTGTAGGGNNVRLEITPDGDAYFYKNIWAVGPGPGNGTFGGLLKAQRLVVNLTAPLTSYPSGWGDGIHTWDVYAEGTLGTGKNGNVNGAIDNTGHATVAVLTITSDLNLKKNISTIKDALNKVERLRGVEFEWRRDEFPDHVLREGKQIGLIAQEVEEVLPELVSVNSYNGQKSVEYANIVAVLIEAVKELKAENDEMRSRIEALENK